MCVQGISGRTSLYTVGSSRLHGEVKHPLHRLLLNGTPHPDFPVSRSRKDYPCEAGRVSRLYWLPLLAVRVMKITPAK